MALIHKGVRALESVTMTPENDSCLARVPRKGIKNMARESEEMDENTWIYKCLRAFFICLVVFLAVAVAGGATCNYYDARAPRRTETFCIKVSPNGTAALSQSNN